ncbi:MAG: dTMP kinase, partial [Armatimonadota bacterium]|nr:dTMP kinase [Armatimonadota bacterium]
GLFITVEGIDGSGKTTVANAVAERLRKEGFAVVVTAEPGGTPLGERLRQLLLLREKPLSAWAEAFLFLAARAEHVAQVIRPALRQGGTEWDEGRGTRDEGRRIGTIVLCDRFADSTIAYQGFGRGLPVDELRRLNEVATGGLHPHLTILLDVSPEIGLQRVQRPTVFEGRDLAFYHRVRQGFLWLAAQEPHRIKIVDASQPLQTVIEQAETLVKEAIFRWRRSSSGTNTP